MEGASFTPSGITREEVTGRGFMAGKVNLVPQSWNAKFRRW